jgi:rod shape-determining protein MreD
MSYGAARPLNPLRWLGLPMLVALAWTVVFAVPLRVFGLRLPEPVFPLVLVFAWAVVRPSVLAPFAVLLMGLFLDIFWGGPFGLWAVSLLVAYGLLLVARSMLVGQSLPMMIGWYGFTCALALATGFLVARMHAGATPSLVVMAWQFVTTLVLYPFAHRLIDRFEDADVRFR